MFSADRNLLRFADSNNVKPCRVSSESQVTYMLSEEERQFYDRNGYLVIRELVDLDVLNKCKHRFVEICRQVDRNGKSKHLMYIDPQLVKKGLKGEDFVNKINDIIHDDTFSQYTENPRLLDVVSQLIGENLTGIQSMLINKPPGTGRHPPHQDLYYFPVDPIEKIVGTWTAIDQVRVDNGCLYVLPGSHKKNTLYSHQPQPDKSKLYHGISGEERAPVDQRMNVEMSPGDTIFLHPLLVHGSGPNVSKDYRKAISCHYANSECHWVEPTSVQADIAKEFEEELRKLGFESPSAVEFFRHMKSKMVKGVRCNL